MLHKRYAMLLLGCIVFILSGCATSPRAAAPSPSPATTTQAPSPTPSPTPSIPLGPNPLGTEVVTMYENAPAGKVTAYAFKQPVAQNATPPQQAGYEWAAIDVRVCPLIDGVYVNMQPWALVYADSTNARPSSIGYQQFPKPAYPWGDQTVPNGQCVRGWITFDVPVDRRPVMIQYTPGAGGYIDWKL